MKKALVLLVVSILALSAIQQVCSPEWTPILLNDSTLSPDSQSSAASVSGRGNSQTATMFFDRTINGQRLSIFNTYGDTATHNAEVDLSAYQVSSWRLYSVQIDTTSISAAIEKEVVGVTYGTYFFQIANVSGTWYPQLAQGFYNQPHDGALVNYSIYYSTSQYNPTLRNNASFVVRSGSSSNLDSATDITTPVNMTGTSVFVWTTIPGENATLSADTVYWACIDGSDLLKAGAPVKEYPTIYWGAENAAGTFESWRRGFSSWDFMPYEAMMKYTYLPWNQTANVPWIYSSPQQVNLKGNSSDITSSNFAFSSSTKNITSISFDTNQSVCVDYNMILSYVQDTTTTTSWEVTSSGSLVDWSVVVDTSYPSVTGQVSKYLNISKANSWTITGLYESAAPTTNHTDYILIGTAVRCGSMIDGTWTLRATSYNHLFALNTYDSSDDSELISLSSIQVNVDVNLTILEQDSDPVSTGLANLTIVKGGSFVWSPTNKSVSDGKVNYLWNINSTTSDNGAFTLEVSWANGTDAGYLVKELVVFYPTSLMASESNIDAFTDSTFEVRVYFQDTFTPQGLYEAAAEAVYSFHGGSNVSMTDHSNGTWSATISTVGKDPGIYLVDIYAEGYALQNRSVQVSVNLIHDTETLTVLWSNTNDITYIETTELSVYYNRMTGSSPIPGAMVNVTIDTKTWLLVWDEVSAYKITFNGTDIQPSFGVHSLTIEAWKEGHQAQYDIIQTLTIQEEPTTMVYEWSNSNDITYVDSTTLIVNYTMSDGSPVSGATVNVTIGLDLYTLVWNSGTEIYEYVFDGDASLPGIGIHSLTITADKHGYEYKNASSVPLTITEEPTSLVITWSAGNNISYVEETYLIANYTMSDGSPVIGAVVNVTIGANPSWKLEWHIPTQTYRVRFSGSDNPPGLGNHNLLIHADLMGYATKSNNSQMIFREESTELVLIWSNGNSISFIGQTTLSANYTMENGTAIRNAMVNVSIGGNTPITMTWHEGSLTYRITFLGIDDPPGFGTHSVFVLADLFGYQNQSDLNDQLTISVEATSIVISWSNGFDITYVQQTTVSVSYRMSDTSPIAVDATVTATIIGCDPFVLVWNPGSLAYEYTFWGSDNPPGIGAHDLTIDASKFGYQSQSDSNEDLIIDIELTSLELTWWLSNTITYVENTALYANYTMTNGSAIVGAFVNATIGSVERTLEWNPFSNVYMLIISGNDPALGLRTHSVVIQATLFGYEQQTDNTQLLTINEESTDLVITWSNGNNPGYFEHTFLFANYRMSDHTTIMNATLNVTIGSDVWTMLWNETAGLYQVRFNGSDWPPGVGTHDLTILADKFGYVNQENDIQTLTLPVIPTTLQITWSNMDTITFVGQATLYVEYNMYNGTAIQGATVNITIGLELWILNWNGSSGPYEITFNGTDSPPGFGIHATSIKAWKVDFEGHIDITEVLTITEEPTCLVISWSNGNSITFVESTTLLVNYTTSNGTVIPSALVNVTLGVGTWFLDWNSTSQLYEITFNSESAAWPGLGTFGLSIRGWQFGYEITVNSTQTLSINSEQVNISSELLNGSTITYVGYTVFAVNYTTSDGIPISGAIVNVTISETLWNLTWDAISKTYRIQFNGSDTLPGLGTHNLIVNASGHGFDGLTDSSQFLTIIEEPTSFTINWGAPNYNNVTYFDYTMLYVEYQMSNDSDISGASVNVTIDSETWTLSWNSSAGAYSLRFNGSDSPPGFGTHFLLIEAALHGFADASNLAHSLTLAKDPTTIEVSWTNSNNITYVEYTILSVIYKMSNGTDILGALVNATIGGNLWNLTWSSSAGAYQVRFDGNQTPPGLGTFIIDIQASATVFAAQFPSRNLTLRTESTTATPSWSSATIDWTESVCLSFDFRDSYGSLIEDATTKFIYVDSVEYVLQGTNGTYWIEFDNTFDLGLHNAWANFSKFGYNPAIAFSISFTIIEAQTDLEIIWSSTVIDYLGQADLTVNYYSVGTGAIVPSGGVVANITIDGTIILDLTLHGGLWIVNLTGVYLDLGSHDIEIRAQAYGYEYSESLGITLTVNEVATDALAVTWVPSNLTIAYTDLLNLTVDYTYYEGDVPAIATVNVSVEGLVYDLTYSAGIWSVSIPCNDLDIGIHTATISAWLYGYQYQTDVTIGINVTLAANSFRSTWEPLNLQATYIDTVSLSVIYTKDFMPILGATVELSINGTIYTLVYNDADKMWHFSMEASAIGLGIWNVTVTANKTGYTNGWDSKLLTISLALTNLTVIPSSPVIYYDEGITLDIYYQLLNTSYVSGTTCSVTVDSIIQSISWNMDHWVVTLSGVTMGLGIHSVAVDVEAFGYESGMDSFDVTVNAIPTSVVVDNTLFYVYPFDSVIISFTWIDDKNIIGIAGFVPEITWKDTYSIFDYANGTYTVEVNNDALHVGIYELSVNFFRTGYANGTRLVNIEIMELPIVLTFDDELNQFENETIHVSIQMYDSPHAKNVDWGVIIIELAGVQYTLVYNSDSQEYTVEIWLSDLAPGLYTLNFTATAIDCETVIGEIQLEIGYKIWYTLVLDVETEVQAGQSIQITILVTYESGTLEGFTVLVHILLERGQSGSQELSETATSNNEGIALLVYNVPADATNLTIWADFEGSIGEWPAISNIVKREVSPPNMEILSFIVSLLENPITLIIIIGGAGSSIAGLTIMRRRRRGDSPTYVVESTIAPTLSPSAPAGEMELLHEMIMGNPNGLTRAQIAQSLEISTSKAGVMVKKLLESDSTFEEVREGRLRRIRFRVEE